MKFIKKHISSIVGLIVFVLVIVAFFMVKDIFNPDESTAIYGSRIEGKSAIEISNETVNAVKEGLKDRTSSVNIRVAGKIVEISIKANEDVSLEDAKNLGKKALESFSDEEKKYYDFQIFVENENNTAQFPIIGYKHKTKENISWTRDRAAQ